MFSRPPRFGSPPVSVGITLRAVFPSQRRFVDHGYRTFAWPRATASEDNRRFEGLIAVETDSDAFKLPVCES